MKLQRTTLILLLLALGLGSFVYFFEMNGKTQQQQAQEKEQQIFSFAEDDIQSLTINTKNYLLSLERNQKSDKPKWLLTSPEQIPANDAIAAYLTDLLVKGKINRTVSTAANKIQEFGLEPPQARIDIKLKNQQAHTLSLGNPTYNNSFLYAQLGSTAKKNGNVDVLLVSKDFANAVNRELSEWKQPPQTSESKPLLSPPQPTPQKSK
ncbi:MAG: DUF4340 domain-containing protein [Calothrix sp. MO_192.B10]|nr:DUF4340 domain-containing protein [Calothrix sp. MO_192.B10]